MLNSIKKDIFIPIVIILIIFSLGFLLRIDSTNLYGISNTEKAYYQDQNGLPYMYELDSYYNYRLTKNYIDHGYLGDTIIDNREWDLHSYYPPGVPMDYPPLIVYLTAFIYKIINLISSVPLFTICYWIPAFIGPLSGIVAYLFVRRYTNEYGGFAAGIFAVTAPFYFIRTFPGWFDTDMFNIIFSLLTVWFFIEAVHTYKIKNRIIYSFIAAFSMFLFSLAWNGWQYLFYIITLFCIFYLIYGVIRKINTKNILYFLIIFLSVSLVLITIITGYINILKAFYGPFQLLLLSGNQNPFAAWPDTYASVSELQIASIEENISSIGPVFFAGFFGLIWILRILITREMKEKYLSRITWFFYLFLIVWSVIGTFSLFKGVRFIMLLLPPLIISSGVLIGIVTGYINNLKKERLKKGLIISLIVLLIFSTALNDYKGLYILKPGVNDDFSNAAGWIHNNTDKNTVIITDWSYGHYWTGVVDRPVSFDGRLGYIETLPARQFDSSYTFKDKSPSTSRDYWINFALTIDNENLSAGIFRMLSTSGDLGYLTLDNYTGNTTKTVEILKSILGVNRVLAKEKLVKEYNLNEEQAESTLKYTHPQKTKPYILITYGSVGGYYVFKSGTWNFNKKESTNITYSKGNIKINNTELSTDNDIFMDLRNNITTWNKEVPYSVTTISKGMLKKQYLNNNSDFCIILDLDNNKSLVINEKFENSLFTKLSIEKNETSIFKKTNENNNIVIWKPVSD